MENSIPKTIGDLSQRYADFEKNERTRIEFEFQSICDEHKDFFGSLIWTLPHKPGVSDVVLREACVLARKGIARIQAQKPNKFQTFKEKFSYLHGCIKRLIAS